MSTTPAPIPPAPRERPERQVRRRSGEGPARRDDLDILRAQAHEALVTKVGNRVNDRNLSDDELSEIVLDELTKFLTDRAVTLNRTDRAKLAAELSDDILRLGPIEPFLSHPEVTEIMVNGTNSIYVEVGGKLYLTEARFMSETHVRQVIERIVARLGRRIDESSPMVDARLPDGSRVNAVVPPLAVDGPTLTIRKFGANTMTVDDLIGYRTMSPAVAQLLHSCVQGRLNILVSGGTGTGKTTLLNVLSSFIPDDERIVTIEDAVELRLRQRHVIRLEARPPNIEGKGAVHIRDLVRNSLRMRPDRIIVGEVRGGEALDMLQAMNTGHDGSLSTLHANSPRDAVSRVETLTMMAGMELPIRAVREQVASAIDLIVHLSRLRDGTRRVTHITEVVGMEGDVITLSDIFTFDYSAGIDQNGVFRGAIQPTGLRPMFLDQLVDLGIFVAPEVFGAFELSDSTQVPGRGAGW